MGEVEDLQAEAEALGVKVDGRWGVDRLRSEMEAAQPEGGDGDGDLDVGVGDDLAGGDSADLDGVLVESDGDGADSTPAAHRAGGYVNHGDGWVLEE